ncbi:MAG TPA: methyltransferase [Streptomyces sp.]
MSQGTDVSYLKELHSDSPLSTMIELHSGVRITYMLQAVAELGIADQLAAGPLSVEELAERTESNADALYRVLRALAGKGIFTEITRRSFALTSLAEVLRSDHPNSLCDAFKMHGQKFMHDAYAEIGHTIRTGQPAFEHVNGVPLFQYVSQRPELQELFGKSMGKANKQIQLAAVESYDLTGVKTLVAVGGAQGQVLAEILNRYPGMRGIYVDRPHMAPAAEGVLRAAGQFDSVEMVIGDYMRSVPSGGDVYLVSHVLQQMDDADTVALLKNIRQVMAEDSRVLIVNALIPEGDVPHPTKILDSTMLVLGRNRDRTEAEFAQVLTEAGLRLAETYGRALPSSVIVATPGGADHA